MHDSKQRQRRTAAQMFPLIEQYLARADDLTQTAFCKQEQLPDAVFYYWLKRYKNQHDSVADATLPAEPTRSASRFLAVDLPVAGAAVSAVCEIEFPNGVRARFTNAADAISVLERL
ncbi:MAG: hypothetical protein H6695_01155 [Deferribacteres bacterium]|nr:hypothetical protein [Deferribacteres bacterium]